MREEQTKWLLLSPQLPLSSPPVRPAVRSPSAAIPPGTHPLTSPWLIPARSGTLATPGLLHFLLPSCSALPRAAFWPSGEPALASACPGHLSSPFPRSSRPFCARPALPSPHHSAGALSTAALFGPAVLLGDHPLLSFGSAPCGGCGETSPVSLVSALAGFWALDGSWPLSLSHPKPNHSSPTAAEPRSAPFHSAPDGLHRSVTLYTGQATHSALSWAMKRLQRVGSAWGHSSAWNPGSPPPAFPGPAGVGWRGEAALPVGWRRSLLEKGL